jgi:ribosomal protein S18 acetylase RimI-like enzyme
MPGRLGITIRHTGYRRLRTNGGVLVDQRSLDPRRAAASDLDDVVAILVSAFYDDPTWSWAFPDPSQRREQHRRLWTLFVEGAMRYSSVWLTAEVTATSVWIPPHGTDLSAEQESTMETLMAEFGPDGSRATEVLELCERAHPRDVPHFYLSLLGTTVEHRGRGHGLGLLAENLRQIDETHMPAYLEASNTANVPLYERHGFVVLDSLSLPTGGPEVVTMWRESRPTP